jgi:hypothetical protein
VNVRPVGVLLLGVAVVLLTRLPIAYALPDHRAYEMVTPVEMNGASPGSAVPAPSGNAVDFLSEPFGDAATGAQTLYQARRTADGWQTMALTPKDVTQTKLFAQTASLFFTPGLTHTIFTTEQPFASGDQDDGALDLYEESTEGVPTWVSQGSQGGTAPDSATYDGATPDGSQVVFDSAESLLPAATGLEESGYRPAEFLYDRDVPAGHTTLVDVNNAGTLLNPEGAILGNGNYLTTGEPPVYEFLPANIYGTTTHAISADGSKVFFESPPPSDYESQLNVPGGHEVHLYMRKDNSVTVPLDNPEATEGAGARYLGASENGEDVVFVSDEGLAGDEFKDTELYLYNTDAEKLTPISVAPAGSAPVAGAVDGVTAISNDGSHIYYVAKGKLATNANGSGQTGEEGQPNLYVYSTSTGRNTFIAQLGAAEVEPSPGKPGRLVSYLDVERPAVPTPDGEVLVFISELNLTGQNDLGTPQIYRYDAKSEALVCISCSPTATGGSSFGVGDGDGGAIGGGSYDPPSQSAPMSATGEEIFFDTENALVPEDQNSDVPPIVFGSGEDSEEISNSIDVYEWENGNVYLISAGKPGLTELQSVTPSGDDAFFETDVNLTGQTGEGQAALYDARVGGGFPVTGDSGGHASCFDAEGCRGSFSPGPSSVTPGSATLQAELDDPLALAPASKRASKPDPHARLTRRGTSRHKRRKKTKSSGGHIHKQDAPDTHRSGAHKQERR